MKRQYSSTVWGEIFSNYTSDIFPHFCLQDMSWFFFFFFCCAALQYSCLGYPMNRAACGASLRGGMRSPSRTWLSNSHTHTHTHTHTACKVLAPQPGIEPVPLAVGAWSLNHWAPREAPHCGSDCLVPKVKDSEHFLRCLFAYWTWLGLGYPLL